MSESTVSPADLVSAAMSDTPAEPAIETTPPSNNNSASGADSGTSGHPAWQEILGVVPEVLHEKIKPTLQKWDTGVQDKLAEYTRKYDPYKPIVDAGANIDEIQAGLQLVQLLNADPQKFYNSMRDHYGFGNSGQGDTSSADVVDLEEFSEQDIAKHPEFKKLAEQQQQLYEAWQTQQQAEQQRQADSWLQTRQGEIAKSLETQKITPDWDYILNKAMTEAQKSGNYDAALDNATAAYVKLVETNRGPVATLNAPPVVAPNGAVPSSAIDAKTLSSDDRKKLLAQALSQALKE